jgi:hypothetical protein
MNREIGEEQNFQRHQNAYGRVRQDVQLSDDNWNLAPFASELGRGKTTMIQPLK